MVTICYTPDYDLDLTWLVNRFGDVDTPSGRVSVTVQYTPTVRTMLHSNTNHAEILY